MSRRIQKHMYAISCDGIGLIGGTLSYSRRDAIRHLKGAGFIPAEWEASKRAGYRTVKVLVKIIKRER